MTYERLRRRMTEQVLYVSVEVPLGKTYPAAGIPTDFSGHVIAKRDQI